MFLLSESSRRDGYVVARLHWQPFRYEFLCAVPKYSWFYLNCDTMCYATEEEAYDIKWQMNVNAEVWTIVRAKHYDEMKNSPNLYP